MIFSLWHDWFAWPLGAVLTNLVASLIWGTPGYWKLRAIHRDHKKLHKAHLDLHKAHLELHKKVDNILGREDAPDSNSGVEGQSGTA